MIRGILSVTIIFCMACGAATAQEPSAPVFVAVGPPATEISMALGLVPAARSAWDTWPPALLALPQIGDPSAPNRELLLNLRPDLLLADKYSGLAIWAEQRGLPVFHVGAYNQADVLPAVAELGRLFGREDAARDLSLRLSEPTRILHERLDGLAPERKPSALLLAGDPWFSFSDASGRDLLARSGAVNICADMPSPFPLLSREWIRLVRPDFIIIAPDAPLGRGNAPLPPGLARTAWEKEARGVFAEWAESGRLMVMDERLTYGLRSEFGALLLAKRMHPDLFGDVDAEGLYQNFLQQTFGAAAPAAVYP